MRKFASVRLIGSTPLRLTVTSLCASPLHLRQRLNIVHLCQAPSVTLVSNPGTDKEESKSIQAPRDLIIGVEYGDDLEYAVELYTDAAWTVEYDPYADTNSDLTIYVKWNGENN